jgi:hypothetical protein
MAPTFLSCGSPASFHGSPVLSFPLTSLPVMEDGGGVVGRDDYFTPKDFGKPRGFSLKHREFLAWHRC